MVTMQKTLGWTAMAMLLAIAVMVGCGGEPAQPAPDVAEPASDAAVPEPAEEEGSAMEGSAAEGQADADFEASVKQALESFKAGMEDQDIEKMMAPISATFDSYEWGDKEALQGLLADQMDQGGLDNAEVDIENAEITKDGDLVTVYPVELVAAVGALTIEFTVEKDDDNVWRVTSMEVEGI